MAHIVLTTEQLQVIRTALEPVELRDAAGNVLHVVEPKWSKEDVEKAKQILASDGAWHTTEEVIQHVQSLETK